MQQNLHGFAPAVTYDTFPGGWISRPADSPSYNVEVTVPGALHPEQVVVVGSHYDGMHVSQGSAFDDIIQLMNGYASGATAKPQTLVLALEFETMLGAWMLSQSALAGNVAADQVPTGPIATIGDIGILQPGLALTVVAQSAYDPRDPQSPPSYANVVLQFLQRERDTGSLLATGDNQPPPNYQMPAITQNGDGLTSADHFPGHNG